MDLVARDVRHGQDNLCIDVSIVDATLDSHLNWNGGSAEVRFYAAGVAVKGKKTHYRDPVRVQARALHHGGARRPGPACGGAVRTLADRIAPRRAGLGGGVATAGTSTSTRRRAAA